MAVSIAGFDPCGGAGVLADIQTMQQCKVQGMSVVTALTAQDEDQVLGIDWKDYKSIQFQLTPLLNKYKIEVFKIGIIKDLSTLSQLVNQILVYNPSAKIIWDPVLKSSSGFNFLQEPDAIVFQKLIKKLYLITPNKEEILALTKLLSSDGFKTNLLLKGGHNQGNDTSDLLLLKDGSKHIIKGQRLVGVEKHGTGCVLSSAIASAISKGQTLEEACIFGKSYIEAYLKSGENKLGKHYEIQI